MPDAPDDETVAWVLRNYDTSAATQIAHEILAGIEAGHARDRRVRAEIKPISTSFSRSLARSAGYEVAQANGGTEWLATRQGAVLGTFASERGAWGAVQRDMST